MDMPPPEERNITPERVDLMWTPEIEGDIGMWQNTRVFPFQSELQVIMEPIYAVEDLRLIHHVASISAQLSRNDAGTFTIWTNQIPL